MTLRNLASLAVALLLGLIAVIIIRNVVLSSKTGGAHIAGPTTPVVVALLPVERGVTLKPAMLKVVNYPATSVPAGSFRTVAELTGSKPRKVMRPMAADEPVLGAKLDGGAKATLSETLTPGMRAVSVKSDDVAGVAGFVLPGDRVDIFLTRSVAGGGNANSTTVTQTLAENARVLGVDQTSDQATDKPQVAKAVTVEVSPDQAQAISLAHSVGVISLALRQAADTDPLVRKATTVADLSGPSHVAPVRAAKPRPKAAPAMQVHVTRGVTTTDYPAGAS